MIKPTSNTRIHTATMSTQIQDACAHFPNTETQKVQTARSVYEKDTCTVVVAVFSVLVTLVLQECGCHCKTYGPGCLCLPAKQSKENTIETITHHIL